MSGDVAVTFLDERSFDEEGAAGPVAVHYIVPKKAIDDLENKETQASVRTTEELLTDSENVEKLKTAAAFQERERRNRFAFDKALPAILATASTDAEGVFGIPVSNFRMLNKEQFTIVMEDLKNQLEPLLSGVPGFHVAFVEIGPDKQIRLTENPLYTQQNWLKPLPVGKKWNILPKMLLADAENHTEIAEQNGWALGPMDSAVSLTGDIFAYQAWKAVGVMGLGVLTLKTENGEVVNDQAAFAARNRLLVQLVEEVNRPLVLGMQDPKDIQRNYQAFRYPTATQGTRLSLLTFVKVAALKIGAALEAMRGARAALAAAA